jgi:hypothetical protein
MKRYLIKLTWMLAFLLGLFVMVYGFSSSTGKDTCDTDGLEKCSDSKTQSSVNIKSISRHLLDFSK